MTSLGDLWYQSGSPYSLRAHWAVVHSGATVRRVSCIPIISAFLLWVRLGFKTRSSPLSLPVLFPSRDAPGARLLRSSSEVARAADAARPQSQPSLFPPRAVVEIDRFMRAADTIAQHGRILVMRACRHDPRAAAAVLLPRGLRKCAFVPILMRFTSAYLARKYRDNVTRDDVRQALLSLRRALAKSGRGYICGDHLTYADICMCSSMYFAVRRREGSAAERLYSDESLLTEFADLVLWRRQIFEKHYPGTEIDAYKCRVADADDE